ncbi:hypothetical protein F5884DRAFT_903935 [Xylogone sp. PMI_703]|nr:hypothetical protein F5884DRAFT_903935 [Xylogone sp. PMI_703]
MLDPLSALGLAGNIVQFVDFGIKVLRGTVERYKAADGSPLKIHEEIELIITDFSKAARLMSESSQSSVRSADPNETALRELCEKCLDISKEMLTRLNKIKSSLKKNKGKLYPSFIEALISVFKHEEIQNLIRRLSSFREQIQIRIILGFREHLELFEVQQSKRFDGLDAANKNIVINILRTQTSVTKSLAELKEAMDLDRRRIESIISRHEAAVTDLLSPFSSVQLRYRATMDLSQEQLTTTSQANAHLNRWTARLEDRVLFQTACEVLADFRFPTITAREEQIEEAYKNTYDWIFESDSEGVQSWDSVVAWLKSGSGVYWVKGKAASGKFTLMRYIFYDPRTRELLEKWESSPRLHMARFYFGIVSKNTYLEKSDGVSQDEERDPWQERIKSVQNWTEYDMDKTHHLRFASLWMVLTNFEGDHPAIAVLFQGFATSPNIKCFVSSRPLLAFGDAFKDCPKLRLQDLTEKDIIFFITSKFEQNFHFQQFKLEEPEEAEAIVQDIFSKASGVFLWVSLVVYLIA